MAVVQLKHPVEVAGKKYEALTLRRARAGDLRRLDKSGAMSLFAKLHADIEKAKAEGRNPEDAVSSIPDGLIDKIIPFLARVSDVDEAVIEALDAEDFFEVFEMIDEVLPGGGPLSKAATSTA